MSPEELKDFLNFKAEEFNSPNFIETDPIQIPHSFSRKEDIEIIGFIVATIAWGNRTMIIRNGNRLKEIMGQSPYDFIMNAKSSHFEQIEFVHRTFNSEDLINFLNALKILYTKKAGLESVFKEVQDLDQKDKIIHFHESFTSFFLTNRSIKHVANPSKGSAAKRINMFLRWMCRKDNKGVDFGLWDTCNMSDLHLPLDVHTGNIARKLGVLHRKQNDWKAVAELQSYVKQLDPQDPSKYDFAFFGLGAFEDF